jgi:hypothetical protein
MGEIRGSVQDRDAHAGIAEGFVVQSLDPAQRGTDIHGAVLSP